MHRRPLGNGRRLAFLGAIVLLVGCLLPWYALGGEGELTPIVFSLPNRNMGLPGIASFVAALATIALIALPYAAGDRPVGVDRGIVFGLLAALAIAGVVLWVPSVLEAPEGLLPDRAYGFWIAALGAIIMGRAAYDIVLEPPRR